MNAFLRLFLHVILTVLSFSALAVDTGPAGSVLRVPSGGGRAKMGPVDLSSSNATVNALPVAKGGTGQATASTAINALVPTQTSNSGKALGTNGTAVSWQGIDFFLPTQTGNSGKFLTTNGTNSSWGTPPGTGATWFVDANISGGNPTLGTTDQTAYVPIENGSLTLTNATSAAPNVNILTAQIGCSSTNPPTGTTCSAGNESVAVSFTIPGTDARYVEACFHITHEVQTGAGGFAITTFQVVETAINAQTILQEGKGRNSSGMVTANSNTDHPITVCGTLTLAAGQRMIRLMYEQDVNATLTNNIIVADAGANYGQHDIHVTVRPLSY